jgi:hypothetical protein
MVNAPETGDSTCGLYDPSMLSASMGARVRDGMCRLDAWRGWDWAENPQLRRLKKILNCRTVSD